MFAPALEKWVSLRRERAALIDGGRPAYDVLLDDYQPGLTAARLDAVFGQVKAGLVPLLAEVRGRGTPPDAAWLTGEFDTDAQAALCREVALDLGFDLVKGRLDVSVHPFTGGEPGGMPEQGLPVLPAWRGASWASAAPCSGTPDRGLGLSNRGQGRAARGMVGARRI